jgi:hypothetical protein
VPNAVEKTQPTCTAKLNSWKDWQCGVRLCRWTAPAETGYCPYACHLRGTQTQLPAEDLTRRFRSSRGGQRLLYASVSSATNRAKVSCLLECRYWACQVARVSFRLLDTSPSYCHVTSFFHCSKFERPCRCRRLAARTYNPSFRTASESRACSGGTDAGRKVESKVGPSWWKVGPGRAPRVRYWSLGPHV